MSNPKMQIKDIVVKPTGSLRPHPKNPNRHSPEQIEKIAQIIEYQGWRYPIKVSTSTGFITSGHGRLEAAKLRGWADVPVSYQDYDSEEQEMADIISDNAIAEWAELDLSFINQIVPDLGPEFDIELLGIKGFTLDPKLGGPEATDNLSNTKKYKDQADKLLNYLESEVRNVRLTYTVEDHEVLIQRLDAFCAENNLDNYSDAIMSIVLRATDA